MRYRGTGGPIEIFVYMCFVVVVCLLILTHSMFVNTEETSFENCARKKASGHVLKVNETQCVVVAEFIVLRNYEAS